MTGQASGSSRAWFCYVVAALMICSADTPLWAQRSSARYVGNTLEGPRITMYKCKPPKGTLDASSDRDLVFDDGKNRLVTLGYNKISSLKYGLEAGTGHFCFPWDSYVQFTKKRHSLLTIASVDPSGQELHLVFELDRAAVRPMLARLETLSDKRVEFTDAVACTDYKTAEECGYGQPFELKGLTKVFIDTRSVADRDLIAAEISAAQLGLTVQAEAHGADILLKYSGDLVVESGGEFAANGGRPMAAGRGEVWTVRDGGSRVVVMFEDIRTSPLQKHPAKNFGRAFVDAYKKSS